MPGLREFDFTGLDVGLANQGIRRHARAGRVGLDWRDEDRMREVVVALMWAGMLTAGQGAGQSQEQKQIPPLRSGMTSKSGR